MNISVCGIDCDAFAIPCNFVLKMQGFYIKSVV
jgi:hypothetical protein